MTTACRHPRVGAMAVPRHWAGLLAALVLAVVAAPAQAARQALVIGNDSYVHVPTLRNARNDARSIATELEAAGFKVTRVLDGSRRGMNEALDGFVRRIQKGDEVVFYFSGHGSQPPQTGPFLLPVDIEVSSERAILRDGVSLEQVVDDLGQRARFSLVIIDACRDDPFRQTGAGRSMAPGSSLSRIEPPKGTMVIMAASKGQQALDRLGDKDPVANGLFTRELVKQMRQPGVSAGEVLKRVRANVERAAQAVNHAQRPSLVDESSSDFFFHTGRAGAVAAAPLPSPAAEPPTPLPTVLAAGYAPQREFDAWEPAARAGTREAFDAYARQFPAGRYVAHARARIALLAGGTPPPPGDALNRGPRPLALAREP
ncbi:MAG: caspase family protein [Rubrivivax sp.]|nr:caspase family protein [Rubrivivax sp.]